MLDCDRSADRNSQDIVLLEDKRLVVVALLLADVFVFFFDFALGSPVLFRADLLSDALGRQAGADVGCVRLSAVRRRRGRQARHVRQAARRRRERRGLHEAGGAHLVGELAAGQCHVAELAEVDDGVVRGGFAGGEGFEVFGALDGGDEGRDVVFVCPGAA